MSLALRAPAPSRRVLTGATPTARRTTSAAHGLRHRWSWLPRGRPLPPEVWASRHRWVVSILAVQVVGLFAFGLVRDHEPAHAAADCLVPALTGVLACWRRLGVTARSTIAAGGLMLVSTMLVHLSGGYVESHFHFFVMIPVVAVYQRWVPFGMAIWLVLLHHGVVGTMDPAAIYNHPAGQAHPWTWAAVHAVAIAAACLGTVVNWGFHERSREAEAALGAQLAHRLRHDALTGLPTRAVFGERLARAGSTSDARPVVLVLDLDGFKAVNDTFGHHGGDLLLVEVASRLRAWCRDGDLATRLSGDEFAVLVRDADSPGEAGRVAEDLRRHLCGPYLVEGHTIDLGASIGVARLDPGEQAPSVLRRADAAMYVAKERGLGWAHHDDGQGQGPVNRLVLLAEIRHAITRREIVLHYQPQVGLSSGLVVGLEALARWQHPTRGLLPPGEFVPTIERTDLSGPFTRLVLDLALDQVRVLRRRGIDLPVSVNVSARCLADPALADDVAAALATRDLPPDRLTLEITEDSLMTDPDACVDTLSRIRELGVRVSLDDFGTGYSSIAHLRSLPVDELKVDRSFVMHLARADDRELALVEWTIDLAHRLSLPVVAEGVEDAATLELLRSSGCDAVQGFHVARPMPVTDLAPWLERRADLLTC